MAAGVNVKKRLLYVICPTTDFFFFENTSHVTK